MPRVTKLGRLDFLKHLDFFEHFSNRLSFTTFQQSLKVEVLRV